MKIIELVESAEDLTRKIASLTAMLNDQSTTNNEKENAASLINKLTSRLKIEYPNYNPHKMSDEYTWLDGLAKAASKFRDDDNLWKTDRNAALRELERLKLIRKQVYRNYIPGDVYGNEEKDRINSRIRNFMYEYLTDLYHEEEKKREERRYKAYDRNYKKSILKKQQKQKEDELRGTTIKSTKLTPEILLIKKKVDQKLKGVIIKSSTYSYTYNGKWEFLSALVHAPTPSVRVATSSLTDQEKKELVNFVQKVKETGNDSLTPNQKKIIIAKLYSTPKFDDEEKYLKSKNKIKKPNY